MLPLLIKPLHFIHENCCTTAGHNVVSYYVWIIDWAMLCKSSSNWFKKMRLILGAYKELTGINADLLAYIQEHVCTCIYDSIKGWKYIRDAGGFLVSKPSRECPVLKNIKPWVAGSVALTKCVFQNKFEGCDSGDAKIITVALSVVSVKHLSHANKTARRCNRSDRW